MEITVSFRNDDANHAVCRNLGYVGEVILGGYLAMKGTIQVGDIQSFIQYVRSFTQPIQQVAQVANMLQSTAAASERVFEFLEEAEEDQTVEHPVCIDEMEGSVSLNMSISDIIRITRSSMILVWM